MKTFNHEIEFDLIVESFGNFSKTSEIYTTVVTENEEKYFTLVFDNKYGKINFDNIQDFINDYDFTEIHNWVESIEVPKAIERIARYCMLNSTDDIYYSFSYFNLGTLRIALSKNITKDGMLNSASPEWENLEGYHNIIQFLDNNKIR